MQKSSRDLIRIYGPALLLAIIAFIIAYQFVRPAPPKRIVIATGDPKGAYHAFGLRYKEILARHGVTLEVKSSAGSVENIKLLEKTASGVDVAFIQGGIGDPQTSPDLLCLASLYFEPLWVFHHENLQLGRLSELLGRKIAVGPEGSGTRAVALKLLKDNGVTDESSSILPLGGESALDALKRKEVDAVFFVASPRSPLVQSLLTAEGITLFSFENGEAYRRKYRFLSLVTLPEGVLDFKKNIPARNTVLLAPAATLVVQKDFHPALVDLLLQAASEVHGGANLFEEVNEFPSQKYLDFPIHKEALRHLKSGPPFLIRYLPFWAATLIERLKVMILPLITILFPLMKIVPPGYRWKVRKRIYHWYKELRAVDLKARESISPEEMKQLFGELERIEKEVMHVSVPLSYAAELYSLRVHIAHVYEKIKESTANSS